MAGRGTRDLDLSMFSCTAEPILSRNGACYARLVCLCPGLSPWLTPVHTLNTSSASHSPVWL